MMNKSKMRHLIVVALVMLLLSVCVKYDEAVSGKKVLQAYLDADIKGFDPVLAGDRYTHEVLLQVYEGLLEYDYLKRPYELRPLLAKEMPLVSKDGLTYTFHLRKHVIFHSDPAFLGKTRYLKASDVVYSLKRLADPHLKGPNWWILEGRIHGLDAFRKKLKQLKVPIDYDKHEVEGLFAPDEYTVVIKLTKPFRQLLYVLAMPATVVLAKEVVQKYGEELINHAVGTGPFRLKKWRRNQKIVIEKNPHYRESFYPKVGNQEDQKRGLLKAAGKRIPFIDEVVFTIFVESQPKWLNFLRGKLDFSGIPTDAFSSVLTSSMEVKPEAKNKGMRIDQQAAINVLFILFNMTDPVLGKNVFLRQAIACAIDREEKARMIYNNRAIVAHGPIPPAIFGFDPKGKDPHAFNRKKAKVLVEKAKAFEKSSGGNGELPTIFLDIDNSTHSRQLSETIIYDLKQVGIDVKTRVWTWPQFNERLSKKQIGLAAYSWTADYPDPENFMQLFYGKNVSPGPNSANFSNLRFDRLFEKMRDEPDGSRRKHQLLEMTNILHQETPWVFFVHLVRYYLRHAWVKNRKPHAFNLGPYKYYDIDLKEKKRWLPVLQ